MRVFKFLLLVLCLVFPPVAAAEDAEWYFHVDLERMRAEPESQGVYAWLQGEVFDDIKQDVGIDIDAELTSITAFSTVTGGPIVVMDGNFSQDTKDKIMALLAADGDITPRKSSGKSYFRFSDEEGDGQHVVVKSDDSNYRIAIEEGAWVSTDVRNRILVTTSEEQMKALLANGGKTAGPRPGKGALLILSAEKTLLQASMDGGMLSDEGDSGWDSNILRNAEQIAFLMAAKAGKLALETKLLTKEPEMAESLASVARGLISLASFDDSMEAGVAEVLQTARVEATGNALTISLVIAPELVVQTLNDG